MVPRQFLSMGFGFTYSYAGLGPIYNVAVHVDHAAVEVSSGCHCRLSSAESHTDLGKDRSQNSVDAASAIEDKSCSKDQREMADAMGVLGRSSPCEAKSFPAGWQQSVFPLFLRLSSCSYLGKKSHRVSPWLSLREEKVGCPVIWWCHAFLTPPSGSRHMAEKPALLAMQWFADNKKQEFESQSQ